jgi:hypothetical protein
VIPVAGALLSAALVSAQENNESQKRPAEAGQTPAQTERTQRQGTTQTGDRAQWQKPDQIMASCVAIANQEELALVKMSQDKLQNEEVKKFAKTLIDEHQAFLTKLEKFAPQAARQPLDHKSTTRTDLEKTSTNPNRVEQANATTTDNQPGVRQTVGTAGDKNQAGQSVDTMDLIQVEREIAQECLNAAKTELQSKQGIEADQCFLGYQIAKHAGMKAKLTVFERHASDDLAKVFAEGVDTMEKHKTEAEKLMKEIDSTDQGRQRRAERRENREEKRDNK